MIIDAHCHASDIWYEPVEVLLSQMDRNGVRHAVLTQLLGQYDNGYQQDCLRRFPGRFASVVAVDPAREDATQEVDRLAAEGAAGIRLKPEARSPAPDPLAIWRAAADAEIVVSCGGAAATILSADFQRLLEALPGLIVALEHLGGWARPDCDRTVETRTGIAALARYPNIVLKVPALGQLAARGPRLPASGRVLDLEAAEIVLEMLERFGPERLMWGSDFPPVASREGYSNALSWSRDMFAGYPEAVKASVFGGTASRLFRFPSGRGRLETSARRLYSG